ncbi:ABC transporter substrate-binding protein [Paenibacillus guangzhouensis]|uniref:ABC transporter substrate-binding protein n=1 Tax=Paenibacillus guangzhouensis TaxID=1473112 RepID=UPI001266CF4A|nr:ABC transporter substrate-binding protein [Paenibacillus guangzhouensis]
MPLLDDYDRICSRYPDAPLLQGITITMDQLSELLCCTVRNAKLIIRKMVDQGMIQWVPGRGRGNHSQLILLVTLDEYYLRTAKELVYQGKIKEALALHQQYRHRLPFASEQFRNWFDTQFGYQQEMRQDKPHDTLRLRFDDPLTRLDPIHMYLRSECHIIMQMADTLFRYDPLTQRTVAHLAHHAASSHDGRIWTIYLRKGVQFHNGKELDTTDIWYTFDRVKLDNSPYRWMVEIIEQMDVIDAYTLQIHLHNSCYWFDRLLCSPHLSIVQVQAVERCQLNGRDQFIGTGPFRLIRNDDSMLVLEAFPSYFRERALLDRVEIWFVSNLLDDPGRLGSSYDLEYISPREQSISSMNPYQTGITADRRTARMECNITYLSLQQMREGVTASPHFRQALALILDTKDYMLALGGEGIEPVHRLLTDEFFEGDHDNEPQIRGINDEHEVHALLTKSNYQGEVLRLYTFMEDDHRQDAEWIKMRCAAYGIRLEVYQFTTEELLNPIRVMEADVIHDSASIGDDFELSLLHMFLSRNSYLYLHANEEQRERFEHTAQMLYGTPDRSERYQQWRAFERLLLTHGGFLPLYRNRITMLAQPELAGVDINALGWVDYYKLWMKK